MQGGEEVTLPTRAKGEVTKDKLGHWEQVGGDRRFSRQGEAQRA